MIVLAWGKWVIFAMCKKRKGKAVLPPVGLTEEAQRARMTFLADCKAYREEAAKVSLSILVWGPNPKSKSPAAKKRFEIREKLKALGHNAMFSEEIEEISSPVKLSKKSIEHAQALSAHLIIILVEDAPGALAEACDFCNDPRIAPYTYVMMPAKYRLGYAAQAAIKDLDDGFGGVYKYGERALNRCDVLCKALTRATARQNILYRGEKNH